MAEMHWQIWAGGQELWETPKHWSWSGPCTTLKERAHFCTGRHAEGDRCRCACGMERPVMTGGAPPKPPPTAMSWPRQNGKTVISEHINALQARVAEPTTVSTATWTYPDGTTVPVSVVHRSPTADPVVVRVIVENGSAALTPTVPPFYSVEERAAMEARIAELERQRDAVLELVDGLLAGAQGTEFPAPQIRRYLKHIREAMDGGGE